MINIINIKEGLKLSYLPTNAKKMHLVLQFLNVESLYNIFTIWLDLINVKKVTVFKLFIMLYLPQVTAFRKNFCEIIYSLRILHHLKSCLKLHILEKLRFC